MHLGVNHVTVFNLFLYWENCLINKIDLPLCPSLNWSQRAASSNENGSSSVNHFISYSQTKCDLKIMIWVRFRFWPAGEGELNEGSGIVLVWFWVRIFRKASSIWLWVGWTDSVLLNSHDSREFTPHDSSWLYTTKGTDFENIVHETSNRFILNDSLVDQTYSLTSKFSFPFLTSD